MESPTSPILYRHEFQVRDYECDLQGIVNNAVYQNYLEHTRHEFLRSRGLLFGDLVRQGVHLVVVRIEMDFHRSLRPGDSFSVSLRYQPLGGIRNLFFQQIHRGREPILSARVVWTILDGEGRPRRASGAVAELLDRMKEEQIPS
ncbi:MAG: acyl-CoA thioesterase [Fibrobacteria bacterium]|nr:acyl-CoA thioesterase [Fibrobacteria bacterium]